MNWLKRKRITNAGDPKGFWGVVTLANMNDDHAELTDEGLKKIEIKKDAVCLDIGCGGGRTLARLSNLAPQGKIYGVDISGTAVKCAKLYNAAAVRKGLISVKKGSALALPFPENTFDAVTAVETFYFWDNKVQCVKNIKEVLKDGGKFIVMLDAYEDGSGDNEEIKREIKIDFNTPEELENIFKSAEFTKTEVIKEGKRIYAIGTK